jgi:YidC/Oxa1 family membrane protein insertase
MDFQRYLLIGATAVLSYMLLMEWVIFKDQAATVETAPAIVQTLQTDTGTVPTFEAANTSMAVNNIDIPQAQPVATTLEQKEAVPVSREKIEVVTNTLKVHIDPVGGDISFIALPKHFAKIDTPDIPFTLLENNEQRIYIAQSGLIGNNGIDSSKNRPVYSSSAKHYQMADGNDALVVDLSFTTDDQVTITKRFQFRRDSYLVDVDYIIDNHSSAPWTAGLFAQLKRDNSEDPAAESSGMGMVPYLGAATTLPDDPYVKLPFDDFIDEPLKQTMNGGWIAIVQHYFISAWIPNAETSHNYSTIKTQNGLNIIRFTSPQITVAAGEQASIKSQFYAGPKDQYTLETISSGLELTVDYGWLWWIAQPLFWILTKIYSYVGNWGVAIIGITVLVKLVFFQLNATAYKSMANMRKVQPKMAAIKERCGDDKQKQSAEMMALYKKEKINPLGGCLPILVQMPVFISLYWVLMETVELRHAPFMLWIDDLSVMDPYFVLPLIMGASMFIQQKLNPAPPDPMQAKVMQWMPVMFTFFFLFFPSGLVLYWVVNNTLSIIQQYIITKRIEKAV